MSLLFTLSVLSPEISLPLLSSLCQDSSISGSIGCFSSILWFQTFAVDLEVNDDWLHGTLTVPPKALSCLPTHLSHQELPNTPRYWSCPEELVLTKTQTDTVRQREQEGKGNERGEKDQQVVINNK